MSADDNSAHAHNTRLLQGKPNDRIKQILRKMHRVHQTEHVFDIGRCFKGKWQQGETEPAHPPLQLFTSRNTILEPISCGRQLMWFISGHRGTMPEQLCESVWALQAQELVECFIDM